MTGPFVPIEDLSKHFSVSVSTIRAWVRQGHIPKNTYIKVGNTYRFSIDDVSTALTTAAGKETKVEKTSGATAAVGGLAAVTNVELARGYTEHDAEPEYSLDEDL
jgi:excisionase family DNA binding protein